MVMHNRNNNIYMVQPNTLDNISNRDIVQADALKVALANKRCGLGISMGVGKTRIALSIFTVIITLLYVH